MHYYKILKHKAGFDEAMTDWEKIFTHYIADTDKHVIFGALPLAFNADGGAIHWTVYGNNTQHNYSAQGTLPLTFTTHTAGNADDWVIYGNDDNGAKNLADLSNSGLVQVTGTAYRYGVSFGKLENGDYTISFTATGTTNTFITTRTGTAYTQLQIGSETTEQTFTVNNVDEVIFRTSSSSNTTWSELGVSDIMLVKGSTAPDHYIPYQQGVGERTANLFNPSAFKFAKTGVVLNDNGVERVSNASGYTAPYIDVEGDTIYRLDGKLSQYTGGSGSANGYRVYYYNSSTFLSRSAVLGDNTYKTFTTPANCNKLAIQCQYLYDYPLTNTVMLTKGSTAPTTYIPYGYQIPLTISQTGQADKTVDIYIGDSPLTEGETVSKQSTGVDIELFEGENTISTTLYNKPEMSIEGVDYVGVGEYVNGQWQIPLTISHITDNLFDKDAHDTANGFIDNKKVYWDGLKQYSTIKDNNYFLSEYMPVTAGKGYYPTDIYYYDAIREYYSIFFYTADKQLMAVAYRSWETVTPAPENAVYMRVCVAKNKADSAMMTTKPTSEYIPHKQSIDYTIPIDAPLTEGQSVSDTVEITAYEGINTLDTSLAVKPNAEITYEL